MQKPNAHNPTSCYVFYQYFKFLNRARMHLRIMSRRPSSLPPRATCFG